MSRRLTVEADGGSRGNPGVAGYGALVRDTETGALLAERAEPLGKASNNVAEYRGLIAGLTAAHAIEPGAEVLVRMDSKLVVEQMSGTWKIKHEDMRRLALEAREVANAIRDAGGSVRYEWIPRAENKAADALSNDGMDGLTVDRTFGGASQVDEETGPAAVGDPAAPSTFRSGTPTRVVLVRHGITDFTAEGRLDGRGGPDPSLNATGRQQAVAAGRAVAALVQGHPARVLTSSLTRAVETGAAVAGALGVEPERDDDWDEQSFGDWDGRSVHDLLDAERDAFRALRDDPTFRPPSGESHDDLVARVVPAWERVVAAGGTTVVVCHRKPILVVLAHLLGLPHDRAWRLAAAPGSLTAVEVWDDGEVSVAFTNRT
ncbi:bifunctional RNase H/acid phosphatase [Phycicoccus sp.]|uniref:bifunctional RNase H/acid phosphatase n=1 Tax=Phycicoccus sp. TaxID=1902410 RepID=UPI002C380A45|nr:bifunctional RNase H/acid phosphatase [Phycicoccus sp.]HMM95943.1 bifunctional RNase H/acid phosphatase [Phycicoccus sp.]